jgi:PncC family amidohydrolase
MAAGARKLLQADVAVSVTGLAGPDGDAFGHPVGTVYIGYADDKTVIAGEYHFSGDREALIQRALDNIEKIKVNNDDAAYL